MRFNCLIIFIFAEVKASIIANDTLSTLLDLVGTSKDSLNYKEFYNSSSSKYIIKLRDDIDPKLIAIVSSILQKLNMSIDATLNHAFQGFTITADRLSIDILRRIPLIDIVEQNLIFQTTQVQSSLDKLWGLDRLDGSINGKYTFDRTGQGVNIYVIDSGVDINHPEYQGRAQVIFSANSLDPNTDCTGHGSHVAGILGGTNVGVAKKANIYALQVIDCENESQNTDIVQAIDYVIKNHVKPAIINLSLGPKPINGVYPKSSILDAAVTAAINAGITVITAAGNDNINTCDGSPAGTSGVIAVGATDREDKRASFSSFGTCLSFFAPGVGILSVKAGGGYIQKEGTSQATPFVTGVVALYLEKNPDATPSDVLTALMKGAISGVVRDSQGSPNLLLQSISIPPLGSEAANQQLVSLAPSSMITDTPSNNIDTNSAILIALLVTAVLIVFSIGLFLYRRKRTLKRQQPTVPSDRRKEILSTYPVESGKNIQDGFLNRFQNVFDVVNLDDFEEVNITDMADERGLAEIGNFK